MTATDRRKKRVKTLGERDVRLPETDMEIPEPANAQSSRQAEAEKITEIKDESNIPDQMGSIEVESDAEESTEANDSFASKSFTGDLDEGIVDSGSAGLLEDQDISHFETVQPDLQATNPHFFDGEAEWRQNCQRCVPAYEMRRRGYDVTAKEVPLNQDNDSLSYDPYSVWEEPDVIQCEGSGEEDIHRNMSDWGDGARAQITVVWDGTNVGHTFTAEQVNGTTKFYDPQSGGEFDADNFINVSPDKTCVCRIDNLEPNERIFDCFEFVLGGKKA